MAQDTSLNTFHEEILNELFSPKMTLFYPTATSTTTSLVSSDLEYSSESSNSHDGQNLYFPHATSGNKWTRVTQAGFTGSSGTSTVSPALGSDPELTITSTAANPTVVTTSAAHGLTTGDKVYLTMTGESPAFTDRVIEVTVTAATKFTVEHDLSGDTGATGGICGFPIYNSYGLRMTEIDIAINKILSTDFKARYIPLSLGSDSGMDDSGVTGYTATNAALTKDTTRGFVFSGTQSLKIVSAGAAGDGASTESLFEAGGTIDGFESESIMVSVIVYNAQGAWTVGLYDESDNAIKTVAIAATNLNRWIEVRFTDVMATSDVGLKVKILATTASGTDTLYWDSHSILSTWTDTYLIPDVVNDTEGLDLVELPQGRVTEVADIYVPSLNFTSLAHEPLTDWAATASHRIIVPDILLRPMWLKFNENHAALAPNTGDTNTTTADKDLIVSGVLANLHMKLFQSGMGTEQDLARHAFEARRQSKRYNSLRPNRGLPEVKAKSQYRRAIV